MEAEVRKFLRFNFIIGLFDGGFFGLGMGFGSFVTILPLFVSQMTDSALIIGLIPAIHGVTWQLPQLFTAGSVSRMRKYKPAVMMMTIHERIPFLGFALAAFLLPVIGPWATLVLVFVLLIWQGLGAGFTANAWTSMIAKIMPSDVLGTFFGLQASSANVLMSLSALLAGIILERYDSPFDFAACFLFTFGAMAVSYVFLAKMHEPVDTEKVIPAPRPFWHGMGDILRRDRNFVWFLVARSLSQFAGMGGAFYIIYAVQRLGVNEVVAGIMTSVLMFTQTFANPLLGFLGDRWSHRRVMEIGALASVASALLAWKAVDEAWLYAAFVLMGIFVVSVWTTGLAISASFGTEAERPIYIGMSNTLVAPATILAPIFGGWLADRTDYSVTFFLSAICGVVTLVILHFLVRDPREGKEGLRISRGQA
jgi:MFS family permease